ncbi:hypothetical protein VRU48_19190 [Pedobacter sp. KR3-3]|uniref:Lipoprotein n=1 Tax=Pedobacter albus TaxID=3113905 RepID=A0ABU7ICN9_9SPHI|nr:hypothetical protein [Pedobacter sp. KR3-3]MEE1947260.1 hypothetical protein [Pedobacter sp. KR3-3]
MKTKLLGLLVIVAVITGACKKDPEKGLTPPTQSGANTFSCKINGQIFMPKQELFGPTPLYGQIETSNGYKTLIISASNPSDPFIKNIYINIFDFKGIGTYPIVIADGVYVDCYLNVPAPNQEKSRSGTLKITKYEGKIVSGTFEFNVTHGTENIAVTLGRFDLTLR